MASCHSCALASVKQAAEPDAPAQEEGKQEANLHAGRASGWEAGLAAQPSGAGRRKCGAERREGGVCREDGLLWTQERAIGPRTDRRSERLHRIHSREIH